jgi:hypothetical protein
MLYYVDLRSLNAILSYCVVCRTRRIKCDKTTPQCNNAPLPSVYAMIALGSPHQRAEALTLDKKDDMALNRRAVAHYGKAMTLTKGLSLHIEVITL